MLLLLQLYTAGEPDPKPQARPTGGSPRVRLGHARFSVYVKGARIEDPERRTALPKAATRFHSLEQSRRTHRPFLRGWAERSLVNRSSAYPDRRGVRSKGAP